MAFKSFGTPAAASNNKGTTRTGVLSKSGSTTTKGGSTGVLSKPTTKRCASCGR